MKNTPKRPPDVFLTTLRDAGVDTSSSEWRLLDPEGVYPVETTCDCGSTPVRVESAGVVPPATLRRVQLRRLKADFRTFYLFGRCPACSATYWCALSWWQNFPDPDQPGVRERLGTWGPGIDVAAEQEEAYQKLLRDVKGKLLGPPVETKTHTADQWKQSGFVGAYDVIKPERLELYARPS